MHIKISDINAAIIMDEYVQQFEEIPYPHDSFKLIIRLKNEGIYKDFLKALYIHDYSEKLSKAIIRQLTLYYNDLSFKDFIGLFDPNALFNCFVESYYFSSIHKKIKITRILINLLKHFDIKLDYIVLMIYHTYSYLSIRVLIDNFIRKETNNNVNKLLDAIQKYRKDFQYER